ncbi:hypothetical protein GCM10023063_32730 [Arthrobacter methylotrophus]
MSWLVICGENGLGALLVLGALTRVAGFLAALMYAGIWFVTEAGKPLLSDRPGVNAELLILYIALALAFAFIGSGAASLDRKLFAGKPARKSGH